MTHLTATYPTFQSEGLDQLADGDSAVTEFNFRSMGFYLRMESFNNETIVTIKAATNVSKQFIDTQFIGFDLSKTALKIASKQSNGQYFCASIADTPIKDHSVDCVLCIFAPFKIEEVKRILKPNGFFIVVNPLPYHLYELKQALYETVKLNPEFNLESDNMIHIEQYEVEQIIHLETSESLSDLLDMTPYRYKAKESNIQSFYQLDSLTTRCSFRCDVYKYTQ